MDRNTPFETGTGSIRNSPAFNWKCGKGTVTDIGISGSNEMDKGKSFSLSVHMNGGKLWAKNWQRLLRKTE